MPHRAGYSFDKKKRRVRRHQIIPLQFLILLPTRQGGFKNTDKVYHFKPVSNYLQTSTKAERPQWQALFKWFYFVMITLINSFLPMYYIEIQCRHFWTRYGSNLQGKGYKLLLWCLRWNPISGSNFHLRAFGRVVVSFPGLPVYSIGVRGMGAMKVATIQVGVVTFAVPPSALKAYSAILFIRVIVAVFCCEWKTFVIR